MAFSPNLLGVTYTLGGSEIVINNQITIDGFINDPNVAFISGGGTSRIFLIEAGASLKLKNAILVQGNSAGSAFDAGRGSAINAKPNSSLSLDRVAIRGNTANVAAVVVRAGTHHFINTSFTGNMGGTCAAVYNQDANANLFMANITFSGNFDPIQDQFGAGGRLQHRKHDDPPGDDR